MVSIQILRRQIINIVNNTNSFTRMIFRADFVLHEIYFTVDTEDFTISTETKRFEGLWNTSGAEPEFARD